MLSEIALTPQLLEQGDNVDIALWVEQLRDLLSRFRPRFGDEPNPLVIANLYGGEWLRQCLAAVDMINDHRAKHLARELITAIKKLHVIRNPAKDGYPENESSWIHEASASNADECLEKIITTDSNAEVSQGEGLSIVPFRNIDKRGFWDFAISRNSPEMKLNEQIASLRPICIRSTFIAIANPHAITSEADFTSELIKAAVKNRPKCFGEIRFFDIHACYPRESFARFNRGHFEEKFRRFWSGKGVLRIQIWPDKDFLNRSLLAGEGGSNDKPKSRWGVRMDHIARSNEANSEQCHWSFLSAGEIAALHNRFYCSDGIRKQCCPPIIIQNR